MAWLLPFGRGKFGLMGKVWLDRELFMRKEARLGSWEVGVEVKFGVACQCHMYDSLVAERRGLAWESLLLENDVLWPSPIVCCAVCLWATKGFFPLCLVFSIYHASSFLQKLTLDPSCTCWTLEQQVSAPWVIQFFHLLQGGLPNPSVALSYLQISYLQTLLSVCVWGKWCLIYKGMVCRALWRCKLLWAIHAVIICAALITVHLHSFPLHPCCCNYFALWSTCSSTIY